MKKWLELFRSLFMEPVVPVEELYHESGGAVFRTSTGRRVAHLVTSHPIGWRYERDAFRAFESSFGDTYETKAQARAAMWRWVNATRP